MIKIVATDRKQKLATLAPTLRAGVSYERRVSSWLEQAYNFYPQVEFENEWGRRFIPDGLLFDKNWKQCVVVEIKSQHCNEARDQLAQYVMWISEWIGGHAHGLLICQTYRPEIGGFSLLQDVADAFMVPWGLRAMSTKSLPRMRENGLGLVAGNTRSAVRPSGSLGNGPDRILSSATLAADARAGGTCADEKVCARDK